MPKYKSLDDEKVTHGEAAAMGDLNRPQPELAGAGLPLDMNVGTLTAIEAVEEEPIRTWDAGYRRHPLTMRSVRQSLLN
ncbi:MAG TPA: hypothetical protein VFJ81_07990 [Gemmatimonadales bacterium]|nr:hypothetical protein [Gemmatimonadales bacterium]